MDVQKLETIEHTSAKPKNENKKFAKGYIRVSTTMQKEDGMSLETQKERIKNYCSYKQLELQEIYADEGVSGKSIANRPGIIRMIEEINKGDYIIFTDLSRLGRHTLQALYIIELIEQKGAFLVILNLDIDASTPSGKLVITNLCAVYQMERQKISEDVKINLQRLSKEGRLRSRPPFGYKFVSKDSDFEEIPEQQNVIKFILELHKSGKSLSAIAAILNETEMSSVLNLNKATPKEKPRFHAQTIKNILADQGVIPDPKRKSVNKRIKSHRSIFAEPELIEQ